MKPTISYRFEVIPMTLWPGGRYFVHIPELPGCYVIVDDLADVETALQAAMAHAAWSTDALPAPAVMDYERRIEQVVNGCLQALPALPESSSQERKRSEQAA